MRISCEKIGWDTAVCKIIIILKRSETKHSNKPKKAGGGQNECKRREKYSYQKMLMN